MLHFYEYDYDSFLSDNSIHFNIYKGKIISELGVKIKLGI